MKHNGLFLQLAMSAMYAVVFPQFFLNVRRCIPIPKGNHKGNEVYISFCLFNNEAFNPAQPPQFGEYNLRLISGLYIPHHVFERQVLNGNVFLVLRKAITKHLKSNLQSFVFCFLPGRNRSHVFSVCVLKRYGKA